MTRIVASLRGTQSELNLLRDLIIWPSRLEGGLVHSGMRDEANDVITTWRPLIDKQFIFYPDYLAVLTGHSLGAGAAAIATLVLQSVYSNVFAYCCACFSCISLNLLSRWQNCVFTVDISATSFHVWTPWRCTKSRCFRFSKSEPANDGWWNSYLFSRTWSTIYGSSSQVRTIFSHQLRTADRILFRRSKLAGMNPVNPMNPVCSQYFLIPLFLCLTWENCQTKLPL